MRPERMSQEALSIFILSLALVVWSPHRWCSWFQDGDNWTVLYMRRHCSSTHGLLSLIVNVSTVAAVVAVFSGLIFPFSRHLSSHFFCFSYCATSICTSRTCGHSDVTVSFVNRNITLISAMSYSMLHSTTVLLALLSNVIQAGPVHRLGRTKV